MYAIFNKRTKEIEGWGRTKEAAYRMIPKENANDPSVVIGPKQFEELENEAKSQRGHGPHNYINFNELSKKSNPSVGGSGYANFWN